MTFGYGARTYEPIEMDPDRGGGPIRRSGGVTTMSRDGMRPHGWPQMVQRTPHQAVYEPEDGGAGYEELTQMKFLPDGRLVPAGAMAGAFGQAPSDEVLRAAGRLLLWSTLASALLGTAIGATMAQSGRRLRGASAGLLLGAGSGFVISGIAGRAVALGGELVALKLKPKAGGIV